MDRSPPNSWHNSPSYIHFGNVHAGVKGTSFNLQETWQFYINGNSTQNKKNKFQLHRYNMSCTTLNNWSAPMEVNAPLYGTSQ